MTDLRSDTRTIARQVVEAIRVAGIDTLADRERAVVDMAGRKWPHG
jgi:hypothetical protein